MNYLQLNTKSVLRQSLLEKAQVAREWTPTNGIDRIELDVSDFAGDSKIAALITHFECQAQRKLSIFRFLPQTCHSWHTDLQRFASINMLLYGWDSLTMFAKRRDAINLNLVEKLVYAEDRYYLLNSKRLHTIINFSAPRYLVSIGIPEAHTFNDVAEYIQSEGA